MTARRAQKKQSESRELTAEDLNKAVSQVGRRISDLEGFDVKTITERFDAKTQALKDKINSTMTDIFGHDTVEYQKYSIWSLDTLPLIMGGPEYPLPEVQEAYQKGISDAVIKLKSLKETLEEKLLDIEDDLSASVKLEKPAFEPDSKEVFVVHGRDEATKQAVARFIEKLKLKPIILHEQPNEGRTVIEKFEDYTNVGFAVILLTPDDVGADAAHIKELNPRARQNVIFELGFFVGKLGRGRVCALYKGNVEIPSDYKGVLYVPIEGDWQLSLAKEIKAAGIAVDLNMAI